MVGITKILKQEKFTLVFIFRCVILLINGLFVQISSTTLQVEFEKNQIPNNVENIIYNSNDDSQENLQEIDLNISAKNLISILKEIDELHMKLSLLHINLKKTDNMIFFYMVSTFLVFFCILITMVIFLKKQKDIRVVMSTKKIKTLRKSSPHQPLLSSV